MSSLCAASERIDSQEAISDLLQSSRKLAQHHITPTDAGMSCNLCGLLTGPWDRPESHPGPSCPVAGFFSNLSTLVRVIGAVLILAAVCISAGAQESLKKTPKIDWILLAADSSARALDAYSTRKALSDPCGCYRELILPGAIADHTPAMIAFSGAIVAFNQVASRYLVRHNHRTLGRLVLIVDTGLVLTSVAHNFTQSKPAGKVVR